MAEVGSRRARLLGIVLSAVLMGSLMVAHQPQAPIAAASSELTPFSCSPFLYQFVSGTLYELNATNGEYEDYGADGPSPHVNLGNINALGYNPADDFMYGIVGKKLYRVGTDGYEEVSLSADDRNLIANDYAGDFIDDNTLLVGPADNDFYTIRVDTTPATVAEYDVSSFGVADFTVDSSGTYAYGMSRTNLIRLTLGADSASTDTLQVSGALSQGITDAKNGGLVASDYASNTGGAWGSAYSTSTGELFFFRNVYDDTGAELWKMELSGDPFSGGSVTAELMAAGQDLSGGNDGASCPEASSPFNPPVVVGDAYAYTTGTSYSADREELGLIAGDSATSSGAVLYKVGLTSDLSTDPQERLPSDSARTSETVAAATNSGSDNQMSNGSQTLTIDDWDTGEFTVTGLSGTFTFYYQVVEETLGLSQTTRRVSNIGTVTIDSLSINANGSGDGTVLPEATQYQNYGGHLFVANNDPSETDDDYFWRASFIEDGSGDSLPDSPLASSRLPSGLSLDEDTGELSGVPAGDEFSSPTDYTLRVFAALDDQFKTFAQKDFTLTINDPTAYTLSYDSNSSHDPGARQTGSAPSNHTSARLTIQSPSGLSDPCFSFSSWNTQAGGGGTSFTPGTQITFTNDTLPASDTTTELAAQHTTLYAQWTDTRVNVTYQPNSSDGGAVPTDSTAYCDGDSVSLVANPNSLTRSGYRLLGWDRNSGASTPESTLNSPGTLTASTSDITVHAIWSEEFGVTFDANSATSGSAPTDNTRYVAGGTVTLPSNSGSLSRTGFEFGGWNTQANGSGATYESSGSATLTMPAGDLTLYARWVTATSSGSGRDRSGDNRDRRSGRTQPPVAAPEVATPRSVPPRSSPTVESPETSEPPAAEPEPPQQTDSPPPAPNRTDTPPTPTVDSGAGLQRGESTSRAMLSSQSARRSLAEMSQERLAGFLPATAVTIEVRGARTAARFVTDEELLTNPPLLIEQMALASQSSFDTFFAVDQLQLADEPAGSASPLPEEQERVSELFASVGLDQPQPLTEERRQSLGEGGWIQVNSTVSEYKPGSVVYLVVNSEPLIVGHATVAQDGTAQVDGDIPIDWFGVGEHRLRAVGVKEFDGIQVDPEGELLIPENVLGKIREFDLGTQVTVLASGANPEGSAHLAIRVVPLEPNAPWWTLWILAGAFLLMLLARMRGVLGTRSQALIGGFAILLAALPAVVLGWISTVTAVAVWGTILALIGATLVNAIPVLVRGRNHREG